jgi:hypothetical protein
MSGMALARTVAPSLDPGSGPHRFEARCRIGDTPRKGPDPLGVDEVPAPD